MAINIGNRNAKLKPGTADRGFIEDKTSYIYGESTAVVTDFSYTGGVQTFLAKPGVHKLRVWGAAGGGHPSYPGGKGGYSEGKMKVSRNTNLFVYVGGQGPYVTNGSSINGGWNGGGAASSDSSGGGQHRISCSGGGGTDISLVGGDCTLSNRVYIRQALSYLGRLIAAGGGGGSNFGDAAYVGGEGGGTSGVSCNGTSSITDGGKGGTQNAGGAKSSWCNNRGTDGTFGYGGYATTSATGGVYEGGGGGWYGGGAGVAGGGGGSGYVVTENSYKPSGYSVPENLYLKDAETKDGKSQFLSPDGTLETGHAGDGHAIIESEIRPAVPDVTYVTQPGVYHNPTLGFISISADGQNWITISDKNVGATVADPGDINSNGDIFQYGNIHHFAGDGSGGTITTEAQIPDLTGYEGGNLYSDDKYRTNIDWNAANKNLWKWIVFNLKSLGKGPCPLGFHVPSAEEWTAVMDTVLELAGESFSYDLISKYLLMVHPNSRKGDGAFYANNTSIYLTNSYIANQNKINAFVMIGDEGSESGGLSATDMNCGGYIRPFRDEVMIPTTEWTRLPDSGSARLPHEYQEVEYIQSSGTQFIDTGMAFTNDTKADLDICFPVARTGWSGVMGCQYVNVNTSWAFGVSPSTATYQQNNRCVDWNWSPDVNTKYKITNDGRYIYIDGVQVGYITDTYGSYTTPGNGTIFKVNCTGNNSGFPYYASARVYACKIYDSSTLVRDFVPCFRKSDGEPGMYDLVTDTFFTNAGTGRFLMGRDIAYLPEEYEQVEYILNTTGEEYINTGITSGNSFTASFSIMPTLLDSEKGFIGAAWTADDNLLTYYNGKFRWHNGGNVADTMSASVNSQYYIWIDTTGITINGSKYNIAAGSSYSGNEIWFFRSNGQSNLSYSPRVKYYGLRMWSQGSFVRDYVPCIRKSDGVIGFYDLVNGTFHTNQGGGAFVRGRIYSAYEVNSNTLSYFPLCDEKDVTGNRTLTLGNVTFPDGYANINAASSYLLPNVAFGGSIITVSLFYYCQSLNSNSWNTLLCRNPGAYHHLLISGGNSDEGTAGKVGFWNNHWVGSNKVITPGSWYHFVMIKNGTNEKIYVNGELVLDSNDSRDNDTYQLSIFGGHSNSSGNQGSIGKLSEFIAENRERTQDEISAYLNTMKDYYGIS